MNKTSNQKGLSLVRFVLTVSIYGIITQLVGVQTIWAQGVPPVLLRVLNEQNSSGQIVVIRGEPVEVEFLTSPGFATTDDMIQLVREDNGQVVSTVLTGGVELGSVLLSTEPEKSLGELEVMYARSATVILTAEQTVFVIPSVPPEPPTFVEVPRPEAPTIQAAVDMVADGGTVEIGSGVFREQIVITGKDVHIIGSASREGERTLLLRRLQ